MEWTDEQVNMPGSKKRAKSRKRCATTRAGERERECDVITPLLSRPHRGSWPSFPRNAAHYAPALNDRQNRAATSISLRDNTFHSIVNAKDPDLFKMKLLTDSSRTRCSTGRTPLS